MESATNPAGNGGERRQKLVMTLDCRNVLRLLGINHHSDHSGDDFPREISQSPRFDGAVALKEEGDALALPAVRLVVTCPQKVHAWAAFTAVGEQTERSLNPEGQLLATPRSRKRLLRSFRKNHRKKLRNIP